MNKFVFPSYSSRLKLALILSLLSIKTISCSYAGDDAQMAGQDYTTVFMGNEVFEIPKSYLSPSDGFPDKIEKENMIEISLFFPNFSGFSAGENVATVGPYNSNQVTAFWTRTKDGGRMDANSSLKNALKYGLSERDERLDVDGLIAYKNSNEGGVTYSAQNAHGDNVLIHCTDGPIHSVCKLEYLDSTRKRGIFASFDKKYLSRWKEVNNKLLSLIDQWKK